MTKIQDMLYFAGKSYELYKKWKRSKATTFRLRRKYYRSRLGLTVKALIELDDAILKYKRR